MIDLLVCGGLLLVFWGLAIIMRVCFKRSMAKIEKRKAACAGQTTAVVQDIKRVRVRVSDDYSDAFYPVYEFYINGERVVQQSDFSINPRKIQKGQHVTLYYNPDSPDEIFVPEEGPDAGAKVFKIMYVIYCISGWVIIIFGLVLWLLEI